eukprot:TRINITY_DN10470_c0_g1_i1.p1 TRINITY_DN10470_c0_g1~~TRINITY_DN10470_c0_g1_i1.p1  ORF type:complete len:665 (-),score=80.62 TRINITY_DN10470_c0_g1_i1:45-2039(-)
MNVEQETLGLLFILAIITTAVVCWEKQNPTPSAAYFENVAWGNVAAFPDTGVWVIAGFRGGVSLIYSTDGKQWSAGNVPELFPPTAGLGSFEVSLLYAPQGFLVNVAAEQSYLLHASDGINWSLLNYTGASCFQFTSISYANNLYLANAAMGFCVSKDALNWTLYSDDFTSQYPSLFPIVTIDGQDMFTASAQSQSPGEIAILGSINAFNWTVLANLSGVAGSESYLDDFVQGDGYFLAAVLEVYFGNVNASLYSSPDLAVWKKVMENNAGRAQVSSGNGIYWYSLTDAITGVTTTYKSEDGINFSVVTGVFNAPQFENSLWLELGSASLDVSSDSASWTAIDLGIVNFIELYDVNPLTNQFVIQVGPSPNPPVLGDASTFMVSQDSISWTTVSSLPVMNVQYSGEQWVGVQYNPSNQEAVVAYTEDFKTWTTLTMPPLPSKWDMSTFSNSFALFAQNAWTMILEFHEGNFQEEYVSALVYSSTEGQTWDLLQILHYMEDGENHGPGYGTLVYGAGVYVLLSDLGTYSSSDRINWTNDNDDDDDVAYNTQLKYVGDDTLGGFFYFGGAPNHFSKDGSSWVPISDLPQGLVDVIVIPIPNQGTSFVGTDPNGNYWTSTDGVTWSQAGTISGGSAFDSLACNSDGVCGAASSFDNSIFTGELVLDL